MPSGQQARGRAEVRVSATALTAPVARLTPLERLEALCDPGSIQVLRSRVVSSRLGARAVSGDGVVGAAGTVEGRPVACYAQDGSYLGGSLGERHADTIVRVLHTAGRARIPVVAFVESGGAWAEAQTGYAQVTLQDKGALGWEYTADQSATPPPLPKH